MPVPEHTGISFGKRISAEDFDTFKALLSDLQNAKHLPGKERQKILDLNLPLISRYRKHVGDLSFTHWATIAGYAPNSHVVLHVIPMWCPPIFHRAEMLPTLYGFLQQFRAPGEFIYKIEHL